jgi:hypothetical protein
VADWGSLSLSQEEYPDAEQSQEDDEKNRPLEEETDERYEDMEYRRYDVQSGQQQSSYKDDCDYEDTDSRAHISPSVTARAYRRRTRKPTPVRLNFPTTRPLHPTTELVHRQRDVCGRRGRRDSSSGTTMSTSTVRCACSRQSRKSCLKPIDTFRDVMVYSRDNSKKEIESAAKEELEIKALGVSIEELIK